MTIDLSTFKEEVETFVATQLTNVESWIETHKLSAGAVPSNTLVFDHTLPDGKKVTLKAKLGLDGATVYELAYEALTWVVTNPQIVAFVKNLVVNWVNSHLPVTPSANT